MSNRVLMRIQREISDIMRSPDWQVFISPGDSIQHLHCLLTGPPASPYSLGMFDFLIEFGNQYPTAAPKVTALTTNSGRTRFNPNIYASGKVCLSILGTWRGESGEQWSSAHGTAVCDANTPLARRGQWDDAPKTHLLTLCTPPNAHQPRGRSQASSPSSSPSSLSCMTNLSTTSRAFLRLPCVMCSLVGVSLGCPRSSN